MFYRYFLVAIAAAAMLLGVQIPNYVDQYTKRVDARLAEVTENLRGFQQIADRLHKGSLDALIRKHEASSDDTFRAEAVPMRAMVERQRLLRFEQGAMRGDLGQQVLHLVGSGNRALLRETFDQYSFNVPLTREAVGAGALAVLLVVLLLEVLALFVHLITGRRTTVRARA